ncbi:hypothetical protein [Nonlabens sp. Asnod2-A12]|uniref:hypothetical protein n=1 Tax=Nonlabens sp. Asnod2-A12 TaxID=3160578 RepID=UPI0038640C3C
MIPQFKNFNLIIWGVLLVALDFSFSSTRNGVGIKFDILNDFIGSIMIYLSLLKISKIKVEEPSFNNKMNYILTISILYIFYSISNFLIFPMIAWVSFFKNVLLLVFLSGTILFLDVMTIISKEKSFNLSRDNFILTKKLFFWINLLPLSIYIIFAVLNNLNRSYQYNLLNEINFRAGIIIILILFIPNIHLIFSLIRLKKENKEKY